MLIFSDDHDFSRVTFVGSRIPGGKYLKTVLFLLQTFPQHRDDSLFDFLKKIFGRTCVLSSGATDTHVFSQYFNTPPLVSNK